MQKRTQEGLVGPATTGDNADHATSVAAHDLLGARGELDAGLALIGVVADNGDVVAGGTAESAAVTDLLLDVGDDGTLGKRAEGQDVADGQGGVLAGVDELAGVHALVGDEGLVLLLELVGRVEDDTGEGRTTTGVVDDLLHDATNVAMTLREIEGAELRRGLPETSVGGEDGPAALTLVADLEEEGAQLACRHCHLESRGFVARGNAPVRRCRFGSKTVEEANRDVGGLNEPWKLTTRPILSFLPGDVERDVG